MIFRSVGGNAYEKRERCTVIIPYQFFSRISNSSAQFQCSRTSFVTLIWKCTEPTQNSARFNSSFLRFRSLPIRLISLFYQSSIHPQPTFSMAFQSQIQYPNRQFVLRPLSISCAYVCFVSSLPQFRHLNSRMSISELVGSPSSDRWKFSKKKDSFLESEVSQMESKKNRLFPFPNFRRICFLIRREALEKAKENPNRHRFSLSELTRLTTPNSVSTYYHFRFELSSALLFLGWYPQTHSSRFADPIRLKPSKSQKRFRRRAYF